MPLIRCSDQQNITLEEFYTKWALEEDEHSAELGKGMLLAVDLLQKTFLKTNIYGLTSLAQLVLLSKDSYRTDWYVSIIINGTGGFHIEYLIPENKRPWPDAKIKGEAKTPEELKIMIVIAMTESLGWPESDELKELYQTIPH